MNLLQRFGLAGKVRDFQMVVVQSSAMMLRAASSCGAMSLEGLALAGWSTSVHRQQGSKTEG